MEPRIYSHTTVLYCSYVIQADGSEIIVIIAVRSSITSHLGAIPVIVSSVLERHSLLIDTIVMVNKDQLPKKYNGEKLRKKVLSMYKRKEMYVYPRMCHVLPRFTHTSF